MQKNNKKVMLKKYERDVKVLKKTFDESNKSTNERLESQTSVIRLLFIIICVVVIIIYYYYVNCILF